MVAPVCSGGSSCKHTPIAGQMTNRLVLHERMRSVLYLTLLFARQSVDEVPFCWRMLHGTLPDVVV